MKKLLLILFISLGIVGCSETTPQQVQFDDESYQWKKWDCFAYGYAGEFILSIGYIPELEQDGDMRVVHRVIPELEQDGNMRVVHRVIVI